MTDLKGRFWLCPKCGKHVPARQTDCRCGASRAELADVDFESAGGTSPVAAATNTWFAVGPGKLVVMSLVTLGLYQVYWFYQQWRRVRDGGEDVWPVPRSIFGVIFCHSLFQRVYESAREIGVSAAGPGTLAAAYILLCVSARLPMPFALAALLSVLPLAAVQRMASALAERDFPDDDPNRRLNAANWAWIALAGGLAAFVTYVSVTRPKPTSIEFLSKVADAQNSTRREAKDGVGLDRVVALPGMLVYNFKVSDEARPVVEERRPHLKEVLTPKTCQDRLVKEGVSVRFVYNDSSGQEIATVDVTPKDCGP